jgi:tetratricopeptide (TPR) repeat protein
MSQALEMTICCYHRLPIALGWLGSSLVLGIALSGPFAAQTPAQVPDAKPVCAAESSDRRNWHPCSSSSGGRNSSDERKSEKSGNESHYERGVNVKEAYRGRVKEWLDAAAEELQRLEFNDRSNDEDYEHAAYNFKDIINHVRDWTGQAQAVSTTQIGPVWWGLGMVYYKAARYEEAFRYLRIARDLGLRGYWKIGNDKRELNEFIDVTLPNLVATNPPCSSWNCRYEQVESAWHDGIRYWKENNYEAAERSLRRCVALEPLADGCFHLLGQVLQGENRWTDAISPFQSAVSINPTKENLQDLEEAKDLSEYDKAKNALDKGNYAYAETGFRRYLNRNPVETGVMGDLARALIGQGKYADAKAVLVEALRLVDRSPTQGRWEEIQRRQYQGYLEEAQKKLDEEKGSLNPEVAANDVLEIIQDYQEQVGFTSPLNDKHLAAVIVAESDRTRVPTWLILGQARRETNMGRPINATVADGRRFSDGTIGNAHNLFNIRPGSSWQGKVLDLGRDSGEFRVYSSYEESIKDYTRKMSTDYRGLTLEQLVYKYFPPEDNGGRSSVEEYIKFLIDYAAEHGISLTRSTVPIP